MKNFLISRGGKTLEFKPKSWQEKLIKRTENLSIILKSRQVGMTTLGVLMALDNCLNGRSSAIICRSDGQINQILKIAKTAVSGSGVEVRREVNDIVVGAERIFCTNSNYEALRGFSCGFVYVTEAGEIGNLSNVLQCVMPTISTFEGGKVWVDGTVPKKRNDFIERFRGSELIAEAVKSGYSAKSELVVVHEKADILGLPAEVIAREIEMEIPNYGGSLKLVPVSEDFSPAVEVRAGGWVLGVSGSYVKVLREVDNYFDKNTRRLSRVRCLEGDLTLFVSGWDREETIHEPGEWGSERAALFDYAGDILR